VADIIDLRPLLAQRPHIEQMVLIVLADTVNGAYAEHCEDPDHVAFCEVLAEIGEELPGEIADIEELKERHWWACARQFAFNNGVDLIDQEFCRTFDPLEYHAATLKWARSFLDRLPAQYSQFLKGGAR
jgi:hypothetical protein